VFLAKLVEEGKLNPVVDRTCPLEEAAEALRYQEKGHARGKVILVV
jgi:NADPH:quinone reductase-like Zn-dependent oxidoreductase